MKKVALILMITALSIIMFSAVVSAGDNGWKNFHGVYEMIANGSCIHSSYGYNNLPFPEAIPPFIPSEGSTVWAATTMTQGTWTFKRNGEGTFSYINYATVFPGGDIGPKVTQNEGNDVPFSYEVTEDNEINVYYGGIVLTGKISIDRKNITLGSANQVQDFSSFGLGYAICNTGRVLIKVP